MLFKTGHIVLVKVTSSASTPSTCLLGVWVVFSVAADNNAVAVCKTYVAQYPKGGMKLASFNTTNHLSHLKGRHRGEEIIKEYKAVVATITSAKIKTSQSVNLL